MTDLPVLMAVLLGVSLAPELEEAQALQPGAERRLTRNNSYDGSPQVYGAAVAWSGYVDGDREIFLRVDEEVLQVTDNDYDDLEPQLHAGRLAWLGLPAGGDREVFFWDGNGVIRLTDNETEEASPRIHDGQVVWAGWDGLDWEIFATSGSSIAQITDNEHDDTSPVIHEGQLAWVGWDGHDAEIFYFDGSRTTQLTSNVVDDQEPDIHANRVSWSGGDGADREIFLWDGTNVAALSDNLQQDTGPRLHYGGVVWLSSEGGFDRVHFWDGSAVIPISAALTSPGVDSEPSIDGGLVVWSRLEDGDREVYLWDGANTFRLTDNAQDDVSPDLHGGSVVWQRQQEIYQWTGGGVRQLATHAADAEASYLPDPAADIDRGVVVWSGQMRAGPDPDTLEIFVWDGTSTTRLTNDTRADVLPRIHEGSITWQSGLASESEVRLWNGEEVLELTSNVDIGDLTPDLDRGQVAWDGQTATSTDYEIFVWDGSTTTQLSDNAITDSNPQIHRGQVVWNTFTSPRELDHVYLWDGTTTRQLSESGPCQGARLHDGQVVWTGGVSDAREIFLWDGSRTLRLTDNSWADANPDVHEGQVVWSGGADHGGDSEIFLWGSTGLRQLSHDDEDNGLPAIEGGRVAWRTWDGSKLNVDTWDGASTHRLTTRVEQWPTYGPRIDDGQVVWVSVWNEVERVFVGDAEPHAVRGLGAAAGTTFRWSAAVWGTPGNYDVIRGDVSNLSATTDEVRLGDVVCIESDSNDLTVVDPDVPPANVAWFYVVRATRFGGYGRSSAGTPRYAEAGGCR